MMENSIFQVFRRMKLWAGLLLIGLLFYTLLYTNIIKDTTKSFFKTGRTFTAINKLEKVGKWNDRTVTFCPPTKGRLPLILTWYHPFNESIYGLEEGEHCGCRYTYNRSLALESDALVFYCLGGDINDLPPPHVRKSDQKYVWFCWEPPTHLRFREVNTSYPERFFNWTMTYRLDSDIYVPFSSISDVMAEVQTQNQALSDIMKKKKKLAVAVVSNCEEPHQAPQTRIQLIDHMKKSGLDVDLFGSCFQNEISRKINLTASIHLEGYKFYLAFENSYHCKDYISEKFWRNGLYNGLVPVVWGGRKEDYEAVAPKSSFIHAEDFESPKKLVEYLSYLDKNNTAYLEYLQWRVLDKFSQDDIYGARQPPLRYNFKSSLCVLCHSLIKRRDSNDCSSSQIKVIDDFICDISDDECMRVPNQNDPFWMHGRTDWKSAKD